MQETELEVTEKGSAQKVEIEMMKKGRAQEEVKIEKAQNSDLPQLLELYAFAREFMKRTGNPNQWKDKTPRKEVLEANICAGQLYVFRNGERIVGAFALIIGKDPTYAVIEQGAWRSEREYGTLHRIAGNGTVHGLFRRIVAFSEQKIRHLRIDTHEDNRIMQHLIEQNGFQKCGIIYTDDGTARIAYEKLETDCGCNLKSDIV